MRGNPEAVNNLLMHHIAITTERAGQDGFACPKNLCPDQQQLGLTPRENSRRFFPTTEEPGIQHKMPQVRVGQLTRGPGDRAERIRHDPALDEFTCFPLAVSTPRTMLCCSWLRPKSLLLFLTCMLQMQLHNACLNRTDSRAGKFQREADDHNNSPRQKTAILSSFLYLNPQSLSFDDWQVVEIKANGM